MGAAIRGVGAPKSKAAGAGGAADVEAAGVEVEAEEEVEPNEKAGLDEPFEAVVEGAAPSAANGFGAGADEVLGPARAAKGLGAATAPNGEGFCCEEGVSPSARGLLSRCADLQVQQERWVQHRQARPCAWAVLGSCR